MPTRLEPKLVTVFREGYSTKQFTADLIAGLIVGIVALPLGIAFAIASGVKPEQGLYTAIIAGLVIGSLGGSRAQISGPTGAFIVIIYGIVQQYGYEGLATATIIAGFILIAMGLARMGAFLIHPVSGYCRLYQRHRAHHLFGANQRFPGFEVGECACGLR